MQITKHYSSEEDTARGILATWMVPINDENYAHFISAHACFYACWDKSLTSDYIMSAGTILAGVVLKHDEINYARMTRTLEYAVKKKVLRKRKHQGRLLYEVNF